MKNKELSRESRLFWGVSYLITLLLWVCDFWPDMKGLDNFIVGALIAVVLAGVTFWIVGIGLAILWFPVRVFAGVLEDLTNKR